MQQPTQPSNGVPVARSAPQPRKDRRWLTLVIVLLLIPVITVLRLAPLFAAYRSVPGMATYDNLARDHLLGQLVYQQSPPVGGAHSSAWQNCGIYDQIIPNETAVHSLEHGAVWITYKPDLAPADIEQLRTLVVGRTYVLLSPYPNQPAQIAATAWGLQLHADNVGDERIKRFVNKYMQGVQTPEPGALCSGGGEGVPIAR